MSEELERASRAAHDAELRDLAAERVNVLYEATGGYFQFGNEADDSTARWALTRHLDEQLSAMVIVPANRMRMMLDRIAGGGAA